MSRSKKSRKPGGAPTAKPKLSKQELSKVEKRVRKKTGKASGNRQKEATQNLADKSQSGEKRDPRLGSKTPIVLGNVKVKPAPKETKKPQKAPIASVRFVDNTDADLSSQQNLSAEDELNAIEQDEMLQSILGKQEADIALTEQEVDYYNELMERHQVLSEQLGLDEEDEVIESDDSAQGESEDDLWDKLDNHDFSDFEDKES